MTVDSGGVFNLQGEFGNLITLQSDTTVAWDLVMNGSYDIDHIDVSYSDASSGSMIYTTGTTDSGNNINWVIDGGVIVTWDGSNSTDWAIDAN